MDPAPKILIVDDDAVVAESVKAVLNRREYDITVTNDALEGVELLHQKEYDLAVLDVMMPVMSGFQIMESVKDLGLDTLPNHLEFGYDPDNGIVFRHAEKNPADEVKEIRAPTRPTRATCFKPS